MADKTPIDDDMIRALAALLDETNLTEIEYEAGGVRLRVARQAAAVAAPAPAPAPAAAPAPASGSGEAAAQDAASHPGAVVSPMVGVAYMAPEPGAAPYVRVGDQVSEGQTLMLIEAMKTFNPIHAPRSGKVTQVLVSDGAPVEFGEALMIIE